MPSAVSKVQGASRTRQKIPVYWQALLFWHPISLKKGISKGRASSDKTY